MGKTAELLLEEDIQAVYLGNLNTVEYDLKLPSKGKNGSDITWYSDNDLYLKPDGSVSRPVNGIGDRKVNLYGIFRYMGKEKKKTYKVNILEQEMDIVIQEVLPLKRVAKCGQTANLPQAVVVKGDNGHLYSRSVAWEGGNDQVFEKRGIYVLSGEVRDTDIPAKLTVSVEEQVKKEFLDHTPVVSCMDKGETLLTEGSPFYRAMKRGTDYLKNLDDNQLLYNFKMAAGLDTLGAEEMLGWDSPECLLRGHTTGHYLSALALCYRETKDDAIRNKIYYMVDELGKCQQAFSRMEGFHEGYLGAYSEEQFDLLEQGVPYPDIWAPYYTLHKLLAGLLDIYYQTGYKKALEIGERSAMWVYHRLSRLSKGQREAMWDTYIAGEFGGINETLVRFYEITGKEEYLETARMFDNDRLFVPLEEKKDALEGMHANQHIPQIIGCMEMFRATGEKKYYEMAEYFWKIVTGAHIYANGGASEAEMFFEPGISERYITTETAEYCVSYNMLKLTKELFCFCPKASYMDYYERTMFNHIAAGIYHDTSGRISYFYSMAPGAEKDIKFENACCHGTGMESQMKYTEAIYAHSADVLYINLFLNSQTYWEEKELKVTQRVAESEPGHVIVEFEGSEECRVKIRCPYWCEGRYTVMSNTGKIVAKCDSDGYIIIDRKCADNKIEIQFYCRLHEEPISEGAEITSLSYGPYVLAAISEQEGYLTYGSIENELKKEEGDGLRFLTKEGLTWLPLSDVNEEKHHVYWKKE